MSLQNNHINSANQQTVHNALWNGARKQQIKTMPSKNAKKTVWQEFGISQL